MASNVYCLYSTEDGMPRYVDAADVEAGQRLKELVVQALEKAPGSLYDWMRDVWRRGFDVAHHTLQEGVTPGDVDMFRNYWRGQFSGLIDAMDSAPAQNSQVADQVVTALRKHLAAELQRQGQ